MGVNVRNISKVRGEENEFIIRSAERSVACSQVPSVFSVCTSLFFLLQYDDLLHVFPTLFEHLQASSIMRIKNYTSMYCQTTLGFLLWFVFVCIVELTCL